VLGVGVREMAVGECDAASVGQAATSRKWPRHPATSCHAGREQGCLAARGGGVVRLDYKKAKREVDYHTTTGADRCGWCVQLNGPHGCEKVAGKVHANGWCELFRKTGARPER
jgi:hypothetical protein